MQLLLIAFSLQDLPALNAALNATSTLLLILGYLLIKDRRESAHKWSMLAAFGVSILFLISYLTYHFLVEGVKKFSGPPPWSYLYYAMLGSHIVLAAAVPVLAITTIYQGFRDNRAKHLRLAHWTWPIWLYVSVTGVLIYLVLYHLYPS